jgi:hypothetical protein
MGQANIHLAAFAGRRSEKDITAKQLGAAADFGNAQTLSVRGENPF